MAIIKLHAKRLTDADYIRGLAQNDDKVVSEMYKEWIKYFDAKSYNLFFNMGEDKKDIRQDAFLELLNMVRLGKIYTSGDQVMGRNGKAFSCNLMTFLMAVAVNKKREIVRKKEQLKYWDEIYSTAERQMNPALSPDGMTYSQEEQVMHEIIANCLSFMPKRCKEILTMFYYQEKSLDEIMVFFSKSEEGIKSKDALKTRKNKCMNSLREEAKKRYSYYLNH